MRDRETYGIAYCEVIRDMQGNVVQLEFIIDTPSIDTTYPLEPYIDTKYFFIMERLSAEKEIQEVSSERGRKNRLFQGIWRPADYG